MKLLLTALALATLAFGRPKTDVLVMKNGDRITCEIKKVEGGVVLASIDYVDGNISIDWLKVDRIESNALFAVKLEDGTTLAATLISRESEGKRVVEIHPVNMDPFTIEPNKVVSLDQASLSFWRRFDGGLTLGFQYAKGNSTTQYNLGSDLGYQESRFGVRFRYNSSLSSSTGAEASTRNQAELSGYHLFTTHKNLFYQGGITYLQSSVQSIDQQIGVVGGLGYFLKNSNRVKWAVQAGPAWQRTNYVPGADLPDSQNIVGALLGTTWESFRFKKTRLTVSAYALPALNDIGRVFSRVNATYYLKLFRKIDLDFSTYGSWDSRPPAHLQGSDYGTSTGLSVSFGNH